MADFLEIRLDERISYGAQGGPKFSTNIIQIQNGFESRNINWAYPLCEYDISYSVRQLDDLKEIVKFFRIVKGKAIGFRFKDWSDFDIIQSESCFNKDLGIIGEQTAQLYKKYDDGFGNIEYRKITKIKENTFKLYKSSTLNNSYSLNINTGVITFDALISKTITNSTKDNNCLITSVNHGLITGDKVLIKNVLGMIELNNNYYTITVVNSDSFRLNINSNLFTDYISGGLFEKYTDNSVYTFECEFDVPVRFDTDKINLSIDDYNVGSWSSIPLVEIRGV